MSSYRISRFPVPLSVFLKIQPLVAGLDKNHRRLVLHVLASNVLNLNKMHRHGLVGWQDLAVELPCQTVRDLFTDKIRPKTVDQSLLIISPYSEGQCQSFRASDALLDLVLNWSPASAEEASKEPTVNLFDGNAYGIRPPKPGDYDFEIEIPKVVGDAIRCFEHCPFNYSALEQHLAEFGERAQLATGDVRARLERSLRNDLCCAARIRLGSPVGADGVHLYAPEFNASYTGRIIEVSGGTQSCSKAMKEALFRDIPDLRNYDLKAAQAWILLQELEDADLPRDWIASYLGTPDAAQVQADALGISRDAYKQCLYGTIMGSPHVWFPNAGKNETYRVILGECQGDRQRAKRKLGEVYRALAHLKREVGAWHDHLMTAPNCRHVEPTWKKVRSLKNACGQHFKLEGYRADKLRRKAAAFILQGQEAAFIHRLTVLGKKHRFMPVSNQHDGLVVLGEIPQAAVDLAKTSSGLRYATMEVKPFL